MYLAGSWVCICFVRDPIVKAGLCFTKFDLENVIRRSLDDPLLDPKFLLGELARKLWEGLASNLDMIDIWGLEREIVFLAAGMGL
jgi:hypothetical protein